jgi:hypothetical protein
LECQAEGNSRQGNGWLYAAVFWKQIGLMCFDQVAKGDYYTVLPSIFSLCGALDQSWLSELQNLSRIELLHWSAIAY